MTQDADRVASARRAAASGLALLAFVGAGAAQAGDRAQLNLIGYSLENRYFAFEEYGVQDGSGFPYSNIYLIDLSTDQWVSGSPIRVLLNDEGDETQSLRAARDQAAQKAAPLLEQFAIDTPSQIVALLGDGERDSDGHSLDFGAPLYFPGQTEGQYSLNLQTFDAESSEPCSDYLGESAKGFMLTLKGDGEPRELFHDERLPASRGCPNDYRIFAVVSPLWTGDLSGGVAIISSYPFGFEGPDRRFIAIPLGAVAE
jgi:predicted secreted protein